MPLTGAQAECCFSAGGREGGIKEKKKHRRKHYTRHADEALAEPLLKTWTSARPNLPLVGHSNSVFLLCPQLLPPG